MEFRFLYETLTNLRGDVNDRYFRQTDEGYKYTDQYIYQMGKSAENFFKEIVLRLDDPENRKYTTESIKEVDDLEAIKEAKGPYAGKFQLLDEKWNKYKVDHKDEFDEVVAINSALDSEIIGIFNADIKCTLEEAIQGYWCAKELLKKYGKGEEGYENLDKYIKLQSKKDLKQKHDDLKARWRAELGIPEEDTFKVTKTETRIGMKPGKHPEASDDSRFEEFNTQFTEHICG